jgi:hypothetical protein
VILPDQSPDYTTIVFQTVPDNQPALFCFLIHSPLASTSMAHAANLDLLSVLITVGFSQRI